MPLRRGTTRGSWPALLLALALLSQAALGTLHALTHAGHGTPGGPVERLHTGHAASSGAAAALAEGSSDSDHDDGGPAPESPGKACDVCAAIAVGKLGWPAPPGASTAIIPAEGLSDAQEPEDPLVCRGLLIAAPRGPPAAA